MTAKNTSKKQTTLTITVTLAVILFYGFTFALWSITLGSLPMLIIGSMFLAALSGLPLFNKWSAITGTKRLPANIIRVYSEEHHRSRRVGRRYITNGEAYKMYYIDVELPGGYEKALSISAEKFRRYHKGDSVTLKITPGTLKMPIIAQ